MPRATATRCSVSVSQFGADRRPLIRWLSARALSAHSRAPVCSKITSARSSASRAARCCCACRRTTPRVSRVRARSSGSCRPSRLCRDRSRAAKAAAKSPSAAASRPRLRALDRGGPWTPDGLRPLLMPVDVGAGAVDLAEQHERLERVGPQGQRRVVEAEGEQRVRKVAQVDAGGLQVARGQLDAAEHAPAEQSEQREVRAERDSAQGRCPRLLRASPRSASTSALTLPPRRARATCASCPPSLLRAVRGRERSLQAARGPLGP